MPYSRETETALLKWVNTFPLDSKIESLAELSDALVLCTMLEDIDAEYAISDLERDSSPSKWLSRKKCLEAVYRSLLRYIRNHTLDLDHLTLDTTIDFDKIAEHDDGQQTMKLLTIFLMAAVKGPAKEKYVNNIMSQLDASAQFQIMNLIQQLEKVEEVPATLSTTDPVLPQKLTNDFQLAFEEEHASLQHEHEALKKKHADFITRFEHLQAKHDDLHEHNDRIEEQLRTLQESNIGDPTEYIKDLRKQIEERDELIATHEQEAEVNRITREKQTRELASLRPSAQRLTELEDEVKVLKTDNASLTKKANMVDHFQKKLEMQIVTEKENSNLRQQVDVLQGNQQAFDKVYEENDALRTTIGEYKKRFQTYENEVMTLTTQKATLQAENRYSLERIDALTASKQHDEEFIKTLQEQINTSDQPLSAPKSPSGRTATLTLEEELEQSDDPAPNYLLEISRLKAENQLLKSNTAGTTNATLRIDLEESERIRIRLTENLQELTEKHAIGQEQLRAIISTSSGEKLVKNIDVALNIGLFRILTEGFYRDDAVIHTRKLYLENSRELSEVKSKLAELEAMLSSRDRELLSSQADLAAVDRDELDALQELKATNEIITSSIQNDLLLLQSRHKNLLTDHEQQKSHLVEALLEKDKLRQELAVLKEAKDSGNNDVLREIDAQATDETAKTALQALKEQTENQEGIIQDLHRRLKVAEEGGLDAQKSTNEAMIKNLTRENALIATAWYDLTSRLQSNHVVLQRRQDAPKSWLNKQRQMMSTMPRR